MRRSSVTVLSLALLAACEEGTLAPSAPSLDRQGTFAGEDASAYRHVDLAAERAALLAADAAVARGVEAAGLVAGFPDAFAVDGYYMHNLAPTMQGRETIRAFLRSLYGDQPATQQQQASYVDVAIDGEHGYTYGWGAQSLPDSRAPYNRYIAFWKKEGGAWKIAAYVRAGAGAPEGAAPAGFASPDYRNYRYFPNIDVAAEAEAVKAQDVAFSDASQTPGWLGDAFASFAAANAVRLGAFGNFYGREAIRDSWGPPDPTFAMNWWPQYAEVARSGELAFTIGVAETVQYDAAGNVIGRGYPKYLTVWKKHPTGKWEWVVDGGNGNPGPTPR
jgi:ketosteroid isomerase-like protein